MSAVTKWFIFLQIGNLVNTFFVVDCPGNETVMIISLLLVKFTWANGFHKHQTSTFHIFTCLCASIVEVLKKNSPVCSTIVENKPYLHSQLYCAPLTSYSLFVRMGACLQLVNPTACLTDHSTSIAYACRRMTHYIYKAHGMYSQILVLLNLPNYNIKTV